MLLEKWLILGLEQEIHKVKPGSWCSIRKQMTIKNKSKTKEGAC